MKGEMDVIDSLTQAVSILNNMEEYLEGLYDRLSECDSTISDYEHLIENMEPDNLDLLTIFIDMKKALQERRIIKKNLTLKDNYKNLVDRLNNSKNREFLLQNMKNVESKLGTKYHNRVLTEQYMEQLVLNRKKRGRPKKSI